MIQSQGQNNEARALQRNRPTKATLRTSWKISTMRQSLMPVIFAAALLFECCALSVAVPMGKTDDGSLEQDTLASLLSDEASENGFGDAELAATAGKTRVIVIANPSLWRDLRTLHGGLSLLKRRVDDNGQIVEHRDAGQDLNIPILRRDTMRCMVGRVYRPCWEV